MSQLIAALGAIPQIIGLITNVWNYLNKISGNDPSGLVLKLNDAFTQLNQAKTNEDHAAAAKALADAIRAGR